MGYIEKNLAVGEKIIYRAKVAWAALIFPTIIFALLIWISVEINKYFAIFVVLVIIYALGRVLLSLASVEFALTTSRIVAKQGILNQHSMEVLLNKVESVSVSQSLGGRILDFGTVTVIGSGGTKESFRTIRNPKELRKRINEQIAFVTQ